MVAHEQAGDKRQPKPRSANGQRKKKEPRNKKYHNPLQGRGVSCCCAMILLKGADLCRTLL